MGYKKPHKWLLQGSHPRKLWACACLALREQTGKQPNGKPLYRFGGRGSGEWSAVNPRCEILGAELLAPVVPDASISLSGFYRWWLSRTWDPAKPIGLVCMLNPSTANGFKDDPTVSTLIQRGRETWGWGGFLVVNLGAYITSSPKMLVKAADPVGSGNDGVIGHLAQQTLDGHAQIVVAWGCAAACTKIEGPFYGRDAVVLEQLRALGDVYCLGRTANGSPTHPMARGKHRIPVETPLELYARKTESAS